MKQLLRAWKWIVAAVVTVAVVAYALNPEPVSVDTAAVARGLLRVTVEEEGRTRVREPYVVSTPLAGHRLRLEVHAGDPVVAGETLLAVIEPTPPALLDVRTREEARARLGQAQAALHQAQAQEGRASTDADHARRTAERTRRLAQQGAVTRQEADDSRRAQESAAETLRAARFAVQVAAHELEQARAVLRTHLGGNGDGRGGEPFRIHAPISGRVLRILCEESAGVVAAGAPLLELGDPANLEVEVDVLSSDGVRIPPGAPVQLENWGGEAPLEGRVRRVEPGAFTEVSALGVKEQRVTVWIDLMDPPEERRSLGDGFRLDARIVVAERRDVLKVPEGALYHRGEAWEVFAVREGRAQATAVTVGLRNGLEAEILSGLEEGAAVIVFPDDTLRSGVAVRSNPDSASL